jgi:hypothetical protein
MLYKVMHALRNHSCDINMACCTQNSRMTRCEGCAAIVVMKLVHKKLNV